MLTPRERQVLDCIRNNPMASQEAIASRLGLSRAAVAVHITNLGAKGLIRGRAYVLNEAPYVVAVGGATIDISGRPAARLRAGDSNPGTVTLSAGGVARNVAESTSRLGINCRLITVVGDDNHGDLIASTAHNAGIDVAGIVRLAGQRTATYVSIFDERGDLGAGISDMEIMDQLSVELLQEQESSLRNASAIFLDANLSENALGYLFDRFSDKTIIADPVSVAKAPRLAAFLSRIDILKPTLIEAGALLGKRLRSRQQAGSAARALLERGVGQVFISLGAHGVFAADGTTARLVPARRAASVASVSGAGDALVAGLILGSLNDTATAEMAELANDVARIALESSTATVDAQALKQLTETYQLEENRYA